MAEDAALFRPTIIQHGQVGAELAKPNTNAGRYIPAVDLHRAIGVGLLFVQPNKTRAQSQLQARAWKIFA